MRLVIRDRYRNELVRMVRPTVSPQEGAELVEFWARAGALGPSLTVELTADGDDEVARAQADERRWWDLARLG